MHDLILRALKYKTFPTEAIRQGEQQISGFQRRNYDGGGGAIDRGIDIGLDTIERQLNVTLSAA
jgi:hypothetical protein